MPTARIVEFPGALVVWDSTSSIVLAGDAFDNDQNGQSIERFLYLSSLDDTLMASNDSRDFRLERKVSEWSIGAHEITFRVWDNEGDSSEVKRSLEVLGLAPVARIDSVLVNELAVRSVIVRDGLDDLIFYGSDYDGDEFGEAIVERRWTFRSEADGYALERQVGDTSRLEIAASLLGRGRHRVYYRVVDNEGEESAGDSVLVTVRGRFGRAIIVAGGDLELLKQYSAAAANTVYQTLISRRRFEPEDVVYLNPLDGWEKWWENVEVTDTEVTVDRLKREVEAARGDNVERGVPLLIFLAGHGGAGTFQLSEGEILKAEDLKAWLDDLTDRKVRFRSLAGPEGVPPDEVVVVVDFCFSRAFLETVSGPGRVVIGSSSREVASVIQGMSFAEAFFRWVSRGGEEANLWRSFEEARVQVASVFRQAPYMDVDGDGIPVLNEAGNFIPGQEQGAELARRMFIGGEIGGRALTLGVDPEIHSVSVTDLGDARFAFEAKGKPGLTGLNLSFAVLSEANTLPGPGEAGTGALEQVTAAGDTAVYRGEHRFEDAGVFTVLILGQDDLGNFAGQRQVRVEVKPVKMGDFDGDGRVGFRDFLVFARHYGTRAGGPDWDARFDLDGDGQVGFRDFVMFAGAYGSKPALAKPAPGG